MNAFIRGIFGMPGSGKSYSVIQWLVADVFNQPVRLVTNLPLKVDAIEQYMAKRGGLKCTIDTIDSSDWVDTGEGPWTVVDDSELYTYFVIDECHKLLPKTGNVDYRKKFALWLKTLRHEGCEVVLITQNQKDFSESADGLISERLEVRSMEDERDPWFGTRLGDWYQVVASIMGFYSPVVVREEIGIGRDGKRSVRRQEFLKIRPELYALYDSYSRERKGARSLRKQEVWERFGVFRVLLWFILRNFFNIFFGKLARTIFLVITVPFVLTHGSLWFLDVINSVTSKASMRRMSAEVPPAAAAPGVAVSERGVPVVAASAFKRASAASAVASQTIYTFNGTIKGKACINGEVYDDTNEGLPGAVLRGSILWHDGLPYSPGQAISIGGGPGIAGGAASGASGGGVPSTDDDRLRGVSTPRGDTGAGGNAKPVRGNS